MTSSRPGPTSCRPRRTASWNDRRDTDQDIAAPAARTGQAGDRPRARLQDDPSGRRDGRRVRLSAGGLQEELSDDRPPQAAGDRQGTDAAVRGISLLLLHHQRPGDVGRGGGVLGQRPLRPGEPDRPAQERRACVEDAGRRPGEQLGVYGDGQLGLEPEGLERLAGARITPAPSEARGGEANPVADGVRDVLRGVHPDAVPDRAGWRTVDLRFIRRKRAGVEKGGHAGSN